MTAAPLQHMVHICSRSLVITVVRLAILCFCLPLPCSKVFMRFMVASLCAPVREEVGLVKTLVHWV